MPARYDLSSSTRHRAIAVIAMVAAIVCAVAPIRAEAQYAEDFGAYRVRYSAIPTDQLLPDIARTYAIVRSRQRGLLNIAVQRNTTDGTTQPTRATLDGTATSLSGQSVRLKFREISEDGSVYYISEFPVSAPDTYRFTINVTPESATSAHVLKFSQDFVAE
jgi:hypothetical protein